MLEAAFLDQVEAHIDVGLYLHAHPHVETLIAQGGVRGGLLAVRALRYLGGERQAGAVALRTWRRHPQDPAAVTAYIRQRMEYRGPYVAWQLCNADTVHQDCPAEERAEFLSLQAFILSTLRDFDSSEALHKEVLTLAPHLPWLWVEWAYCCEYMDRYAEAMEAVEEALRLVPGYRAAQQFKAHLLELDGRQDEAIAFLQQAFAHSECWGLGYALYDLQYERGDYAGARTSLERMSAMMPRADKWMRSWLAARHADLFMNEGKLAEAREEAAKVIGPGFYQHIIQRIDEGVQHQRRVLLPVGFVRQHWRTCAPATLSALAQYHGIAADHLEIAEEICYDGTSDYSERRWATENGFYAREFRVTWESACALLEANIPFTLATVYSGGGHLQAVVGYDLLRGTLLIRDPFQPTHAEFGAQALFDSHRASGPRGMVMIPVEQKHRLDGIELPDAAPWDHYHTLVASLSRHERDAATQALAHLKELDAQHRLSLLGERALARYDDNEAAVLALTEALLQHYPEDINLQLGKVSALATLGERQKHIDYLAELAGKPAPDITVLVRRAHTLAQDGRCLPEALTLMQGALRRSPTQANAWNQMADLMWQQGLHNESLAFYRIAACLEEVNEYWAKDYAHTCHVQGQTDVGLLFLRRRVERQGSKSSAPTITLFEMLERLERIDDAFAALEAAMAQHPDDAELRLYATETFLRYGNTQEAARHLGESDRGVPRANWLRVKAMLAEYQGQPAEALTLIREACILQPLNLRLHRTCARLLSSLDGRKAAQGYLREARDLAPLHYGLNQLLYEWLPQGSAEEEAQLRHLASLYPDDPWTLRELSSLLVRAKKWDEAQQWVDAALVRAPNSASTQGALAQLLLRRDGYAAAIPAFQAALRLDVDYSYALTCLIDEAPDKEAGIAAISFVQDELVRQVTIGDALLDFQESARRWLSAEELIAPLRKALDARPDLWQAWIAYGSQFTRSGQPEEALEVFAQAVEKFPKLPRLFVEHAQALKALGRRDEARAQAARALEISPSWNRAVRLYVDTCTETGEHWQEAETALQRALSREPGDNDLRGLLGWLHEQVKRYDAAWTEASHSLRNDPSQQWVWELAQRVLRQLGREQDLMQLLAEIEQERPGDPWTWITRARFSNDATEALSAAERATELAPGLNDAWTTRFDQLLHFRRHAEIPHLLQAIPGPRPLAVSLRVYGCHAKRAAGDKAGASTDLQALIEEAPYNYTLRRQLADWQDTDNDNEAYLATAQAMVQLAPNHPIAHGYVGHALTKLNRTIEAIPSFQRAFELDGEYLFAGRNLIEACLQDRRYEQALATATTLWRRYPRADVSADAAVAASHLKEQAQAEEWLEHTLKLARYNDQLARRAYDALVASGWESVVHACVERCIRGGACANHAVVRWLEYQHKSCRDRQLVQNLSPLLHEEPGISLKMGLLDYAAQKGRHRLLDEILAKHSALLRKHDDTWGQVSYALQCHERQAAAQRWLKDWRERPNAPGWAMGNAALANASLNKFDVAGEIARHVLQREARDPDARFWHCVDLALNRQLNGLKDQLALQHEWEADKWMQPLLSLLQAFLDGLHSHKLAPSAARFRELHQACCQTQSGRRLHRRLRKTLLGMAPWWKKPWLLVALNAISI